LGGLAPSTAGGRALTVRRLRAFITLARLPFLFGGFAGFALGAAVARHDGYALDWRAYVWGQILVTAFHLMVHFANDYFDQASDALTTRTAWSGGSGVLAANELPPWVALAAAFGCVAIGFAALARIAVGGNLALVLVGIAIAVLAWCYSAPPLRLLARGLGELDAVAVVAVLVPLAGYATFAHATGEHALLATIPGAFAMVAMMLSVEIPDAPADAQTGKRTLVVRWGVAYAAIAARTFASGAVCLLLLLGSAIFNPPAVAYLAIIPAALVAGGYAVPHLIAQYAWATIPFLGVAIYALTTLAALALVVG
jgi:1,4-dihydroxy-2-naphthoate octaprenyltransferase